LFVLALLPLTALPNVPFALTLFVLVALCAAIGIVHDLMGIFRGRNQGLRARTKLLASALVAVIFLRALADSTEIFPRDVLLHAGFFVLTAPHWLWLGLGILA